MDDVIVSASGKQDGFNREAGRTALRRLLPLLSAPEPVTAVFVASDVQALGVLDAALETGVRVPEDLAVVSFDDIEMANHAQLTTMRQPMYDMGVLALEKLLERTKDPTAPPTLTTFLPELIVRKSCGAHAKHMHAPVSPGGIELEPTT